MKKKEVVVMSVDVGIRNLSFCVMDSEHELLLWEVLDILDTADHPICQGHFKNGNACFRKSKRKHLVGVEMTYFCETHFPKDLVKNKTNEFQTKKVKEYPLQDMARIFLGKIQQWYESHTDLFLSLDRILIELQPKVNPRMKFISHLLYGKWIDLCGKRKNVQIRFVSAKEKLRCSYQGPEVHCVRKGKYAQRKFMSVEYTKWFLEKYQQTERWLPFLLRHQKKDDLCDAFLMALNGVQQPPEKK